jgi:two-component system sensor histidine kinase UhpB
MWLGAVLLVCLAGAVVLAGGHEQRSVRVELAAALSGGRQQVNLMLAHLPDRDREAALTGVVASFDGARHLRASLGDRAGRLIAVSRPMASPRSEPAWFIRLLAPDLAPARIESGGFVLSLEPVAANEAGEVWEEFRDAVVVLALFGFGAVVAVHFALGRALAPLRSLGVRFAEVTAGDLQARAAEDGAPELARLGRGFNQMTERLRQTAQRNARLEEQLLTLQDEERAELARDLHDEIGPQLFVMKVDAAVLRGLAEQDSLPAVAVRVRSIETALAQVQSIIRDLLERLRATPPETVELAAAVDDLLAFWRARQPDVAFSADVSVQGETLPPARRAAIYRLVQEGLSNAARHGRASVVQVRIAIAPDGDLVAEVCNDGADGAKTAAAGRGLGGMRERVTATGGDLAFGPRAEGGWAVRARWPSAAALGERVRA